MVELTNHEVAQLRIAGLLIKGNPPSISPLFPLIARSFPQLLSNISPRTVAALNYERIISSQKAKGSTRFNPLIRTLGSGGLGPNVEMSRVESVNGVHHSDVAVIGIVDSVKSKRK
jgi:hypothetical protein